MNMTDYINFIPTMRICSGKVTSKIKNTENWEVKIHRSNLGSFNGPIYCQATFPPGGELNIKAGDYVKILVTFLWGGPYNTYCDLAPNSECLIIGKYNERYHVPGSVENPNSTNAEDVIRFVNKKSGSGIVAADSGYVSMATGGVIFHTLKPWGYGVDKDSSRTWAQNHQRVIAYNAPLYLSREAFGMYSGSDPDDEASKINDSDFYINYRRFVQENKDVENWVSTCEGFFAPWVGPNNNYTAMGKSRPPIFNKIINKGKTRFTIECGDSDEKFINMRVDDVKRNEQVITNTPGAAPATLGNRLNLEISSQGALKLDVAGAGNHGTNTYGVRINVSSNGELSIYSKGKMTFSHGEEDIDKNSIVMDPQKGIDIQAVKGVRVNGQAVILNKFIEWMQQNQTQLCLVTSIGGPAPVHPAALPGLTTGIQNDGLQNGFTSKGDTGTDASGKIQSEDNFNSV